MLTVNYDRLGVQPGDRLLDMGCGAGRHAYEAARRGARVVALDADDVEVKTTAGLMHAMEEAGEIEPGLRYVHGGQRVEAAVRRRRVRPRHRERDSRAHPAGHDRDRRTGPRH